jgi:hypothetical protein
MAGTMAAPSRQRPSILILCLGLLGLCTEGGISQGVCSSDPRGVAVLYRSAGGVRPGRLELMRSYARTLRGHADFWIQYDRSCPKHSQVDRVAKCRRVAIAATAELRDFARDTPNLRVHFTTTFQALRDYPALASNWTAGERFTTWGDPPGRTQHELFVLAWWLETGAEARYNAVWVVEDDVRYGGNVAEFVATHERLHGPCGTEGRVDYAGGQFKPTAEATGSSYLRAQWLHWQKRNSVSREFSRSVPVSNWIRKVEYVEKYSARMLSILHGAIERGAFAFGEFFVSSLCALHAPDCAMLDIACCPPSAEWEYLKHCDFAGLPKGRPRAEVVDCVALRTRHWVDRIKPEYWTTRRLNTSRRWYHPVKWR